jgi:hypothetical protein
LIYLLAAIAAYFAVESFSQLSDSLVAANRPVPWQIWVFAGAVTGGMVASWDEALGRWKRRALAACLAVALAATTSFAIDHFELDLGAIAHPATRATPAFQAGSQELLGPPVLRTYGDCGWQSPQ